ncbi:MAG: DUF4214 domain-containing protein [Acidimicrobiales bacterium]
MGTFRRSGHDPATSQVIASLSQPVAPALLHPAPSDMDLSRRRFLQAAGAAATVSMLPGWLAEQAAAATPLGSDQGVLVFLTMGGGNDGLSTFVPTTDGAYYDARGGLALQPSSTLTMSDTRGLNPNLPFMKTLWDRGDLAVVDGVGHEGATLSHFVTMAQVMAANGSGQPGNSGWLGRILDDLPSGPLTGVSLGSSIPLLVQGRRHGAVAIPEHGSNIRHLNRTEQTYVNQYEALQAFGNGSTGLGELGDRVARSFGEAVELSDTLRPLIEESSDEAAVVTKLRLAARLINANLGVRVISIVFGDFDSHANQLTMHRARMRELNQGLETFFGELHDDFADRTLIVGASEFGRRMASNGSGTDHGTANSLFAIGAKVNGGFFGQLPSLTELDRRRNLIPTVDYRQFYANIASTWLGADGSEVLGRNYGDLGFLNSPGGATSTPRTTPINVANHRSRRAEVARLYLAYFLRKPDEAGYEYWVGVRQSGRSLAQISAEFVGSNEFRMRYGSLSNRQFVKLIYSNVLGRNPDAGGLEHWAGSLDEGVSRGDVMVGFSESSEFKNRTVADLASIEANGPIGRLYMAYFLRRPDEQGLDYWINTALPTRAVSDQFALSPEFTNRYGALDNRAFVNLAYWNVLGRAPDGGGLAHWVDVLNRGTTRGAVMQGFSDSPEFIQRVQRL